MRGRKLVTRVNNFAGTGKSSGMSCQEIPTKHQSSSCEDLNDIGSASSFTQRNSRATVENEVSAPRLGEYILGG